uniref:F-box domain-containing protein n=1 Tax=viral metagenome TaxID=1070528 RepID=A0A6C0CB70_9ZZZZ
MLSLNEDIILEICNKLNDHEKISFTSITQKLDLLKRKLIFINQIDVCKIQNLPYFDRFESIILSKPETVPPKNAKNVYYRTNELVFPEFVTHLTYYHDYGSSLHPPLIKIPDSVKYLTFGNYFNQNIDGCIPTSVAHLKFGVFFAHSIKNCIPNSVTDLTFGDDFDQDISGNIPESVTDLTFGKSFNRSIDDIPKSVKNVTLHPRYNVYIEPNIAQRITITKACRMRSIDSILPPY